MGKTLIINGADFSSVSIGTVKLPRELSDTALEWIAASGNSGLSDTQKFAVDDFITSIGVGVVDSIYSKIDKLFLPMLASDLGHSLIDYANNYESPTPANINNLEFRSHGVGVSSNPTDVYAVVLDSAYVIDAQDCSVFMMNSETYPSLTSGSKNRGGVGSKTTNMQYRVQQTSTALIGFAFSTTELREANPNFTPKMVGCVGTTNSMKILDSKGELNTQTAVSGTCTGLSITQYNGNRHVDADSPAMGAYIIGKAMSDTDVLGLKSAIEALFAAINV